METPRESALQSIYAQGGLPLIPYHGALLPARFSGCALEHRAVRKAAGVFDFSFRARFTAKGSDRTRFLQGMVTNDLKKLEPGQGTYATMLDTRGRILFDVRVYCNADFFILETAVDLLEKAIGALNRYNVGGRVPLEPLALGCISFQGPASRPLLESCLEAKLPDFAEYGFTATAFGGSSAHVVRASSTGEEGYDVWMDRALMPTFWDQALAKAPQFGALPCGVEALETLRIEAGIPRYGRELSEDTLPLEAGLSNALSFTKGCYIGQEIVERARSRGHVNWKLVGLLVDSSQPPAVGEKLVAAEGDKEIGEITSACYSPSLHRTIALAYVRREFQQPSTRIKLRSGVVAEVSLLPFYPQRVSWDEAWSIPAAIPNTGPS
jgi:glycine cleavage system T protein